MKSITEDLYSKIVVLSAQVKEEFRKQGIAIPVKNSNGTIRLGSYTLLKTSAGFYAILDYIGAIIIDRINLPQSAAILANNLAVGKFPDQDIIMKDRNYGYALFEETLHKNAAGRNRSIDADYADLRTSKYNIARLKKNALKRDILRSFEMLLKVA